MAQTDEIIQVVNQMGAAVDDPNEVEVIENVDDIEYEHVVSIPGIKRDENGNFLKYCLVGITTFAQYFQDAVLAIQNAWSEWFSTGENNVQSQWAALSENVQTATREANDAATAAAGAENVDAELDGYVITVTNRAGISSSIDLQVDIDGKLDKITSQEFNAIFT